MLEQVCTGTTRSAASESDWARLPGLLPREGPRTGRTCRAPEDTQARPDRHCHEDKGARDRFDCLPPLLAQRRVANRQRESLGRILLAHPEQQGVARKGAEA